MATFLDRVRPEKAEEVRRLEGDPALAALLDERPPARHAFRRALQRPGLAFIAEVKRHSPSRGAIRALESVLPAARALEGASAAALSILTDHPHFRGRLEHLSTVAAGVALPILRKDFLFHPLQIAESRRAGAHAVLLIAAFAGDRLGELIRCAEAQGLDALVEVHTEAELELAVEAGASIVGVNNRDLHTLAIDLGTCERLAPRVPEGVVRVAESGFASAEDVARARAAGFDAVLVGTALMAASDPAAKLRELAGDN